MRLGLREANQQSPKPSELFGAGKEVVLTERGRPVAVIKPVATESPEDAALQRMADEGLVTPPARKGRLPAALRRPVKLKGKTMAQTVLEDREDRA